MIRKNPISEGASAVLFAHIGCLATHFAGLETVLVDATQKLRSENQISRKETDLDRCQFHELVDAFCKAVRSRYRLSGQADVSLGTLKDRLSAAGKRRNDVLHSAWWALKDGKSTQRRVRTRDKSLPKNIEHPQVPIATLVRDIHEIIDLHTEIPFLIDCLTEEN